MKKYILTLLSLAATMSIQAQKVHVYKNGGAEPVATYSNPENYKFVFEETEGEVNDPNLIRGKFTVGPGEDGILGTEDDKKVKFSKSNLYWNGSAFKFEANQTDFSDGVIQTIEVGGGYTEDVKVVDPTHVSHFYWTKTQEASYAKAYNDGTNATDDVPFFAESKSGLTVEGTSGLFVLSGDEWNYLFKSRTNAANLCKTTVTVTNGEKQYQGCLIIAPDGFTETLKSDYTLEEVNSLGLVCLPNVGYRQYLEGLDISFMNPDDETYWTSSSSSKKKDKASKLNISLVGGVIGSTERSVGHPLRLVSLPSDAYVSTGLQQITVYNNGKYETTYNNTATDKYKVVVKESDILTGKFTVSSDKKKVYFTKSNIYWNGSAFKFEERQTDFPTEWDPNHVSHFYWSTSASGACAETYSGGAGSEDDKFFCSEANKITVEGTGGLYALSKAEWNNMLTSRTMVNGKACYKNSINTSDTELTGAVYSQHKGLYIYPDDYNGNYDEADMNAVNAAGIIFMPATGSRSGSTLSGNDSNLYCWLSNAKSGGKAYYSYFEDGSYAVRSTTERSNGYSLRLVSTAPDDVSGSDLPNSTESLTNEDDEFEW